MVTGISYPVNLITTKSVSLDGATPTPGSHTFTLKYERQFGSDPIIAEYSVPYTLNYYDNVTIITTIP